MIAFLDDISLKLIDGNVENIEHEVSNLGVVLLRMLYPKSFCAQEVKHEDLKAYTLDGKIPESIHLVKFVQDENWLNQREQGYNFA